VFFAMYKLPMDCVFFADVLASIGVAFSMSILRRPLLNIILFLQCLSIHCYGVRYDLLVTCSATKLDHNNSTKFVWNIR
jgi:hypothetical protein